MAHWNIPQGKLSIDEIIRDGGYYDIDGIWNSIVKVGDKIYRGRVETFVFDGDKVYLRKSKSGYHYSIPGGSWDKYLSHQDQAQAEVKEEARILCENIQYTGITYIDEHDRPEKQQDGYIYWDGNYNEVYVAEYAGPYVGEIHPLNKDNRFTKYGDFYPIKDIIPILNPHHRKIFKEYEESECGTSIKEQEEISSQSQEYIAPNDQKEKSIPVDWFMHLQQLYRIYKNTNSADIRQKIINLGWNPEIEPTEDAVRHFMNSEENPIPVLNDNEIKKEYPFDESVIPSEWYDSILEVWDTYKKDDSIENLESLLELGWNPEIEPSVENITKLLSLQEARKNPKYIHINENIIIDSPNYMANIDKWENGKSNILLITGLSGSGKSTAAWALAEEYKATAIHLDMFQCYYRFKEEGISNKSMEYVEKYLKLHPEANNIDFSDIRYKEFGAIFNKFFSWLLSELKKDKKNKYVVEGAHIMLFTSYKSLDKLPIICLGTSLTKSTIRRWVRDKYSAWEILKYGPDEIVLFNDWEKEYNTFKDSIIY